MKLTSEELGVPILTALGIDPKNVIAFTLRLRAGSVPTIAILSYVRDEDGKIARPIEKVWTRYKLTPTEAT